MGCSNRHSDTPENPEVAAFYVDDIMKCLPSDSRFRANVGLQVRIMFIVWTGFSLVSMKD